MKVYGKNIYYEVKMHCITLTDLKELFFNRKYPQLLSDLHNDNFKLYIVSPKGINEEAKCFVELMKNVAFIHGEDLAFQAIDMMLGDETTRAQLIKHVVPTYAQLLPSNWKIALTDPKALCSNDRLIYNGALPIGVNEDVTKGTQPKRFRARFRHKGDVYEVGYFTDPIEAGIQVKKKMIEIKGQYTHNSVKHSA